MSLKKKYLKSKPLCKVSFSLALNEVENAKKVEVLGSFNDWEPIVMRKTKESFTKTLDLPINNSYEFKYRVDGESWVNDSEADSFNPNTFGNDNSVINL